MFSGYKGKMVFLNFWPFHVLIACKMPELDKAHKELDESGLGVVLTVNLTMNATAWNNT